MKIHFFCFYLPIVSKSLLIVLGTLSLPAMIGRGKYRFAGIPMHSRKGLENLRFSLLSTALEFPMMIYPQFCFINPPSYSAGSADKTRTSRFPYPGGIYFLYTEYTFPLFCQLYCAAVCPCQGSCLSSHARNHDLQNAQARLARLQDEP